jgi:hypothetical protein
MLVQCHRRAQEEEERQNPNRRMEEKKRNNCNLFSQSGRQDSHLSASENGKAECPSPSTVDASIRWSIYLYTRDFVHFSSTLHPLGRRRETREEIIIYVQSLVEGDSTQQHTDTHRPITKASPSLNFERNASLKKASAISSPLPQGKHSSCPSNKAQTRPALPQHLLLPPRLLMQTNRAGTPPHPLPPRPPSQQRQ